MERYYLESNDENSSWAIKSTRAGSDASICAGHNPSSRTWCEINHSTSPHPVEGRSISKPLGAGHDVAALWIRLNCWDRNMVANLHL